jgi:hypothetical protein
MLLVFKKGDARLRKKKTWILQRARLGLNPTPTR